MSNDQHRDAVEAVIESYVDACQRGDVAAMRKLFHADASMAGYLADMPLTGSLTPFFEAVASNPAPRESGQSYRPSLVSVSVSGRVATAELHEQGYLGLDFVNYFHLMLVDGRWYITAKLFVSAPRASE